MDGFVVFLETEDDEKKVTYWSGSTVVENLEESQVYNSKTEAKRLSGEIQSKYVDQEVRIMPVTITIAPKTASPTKISAV